jgi:hypothetical protein
VADTIDQRLSEVFDRGLKNGFASLDVDEKELFRIQDFIVEFEMNGLSGYFYNKVPDISAIHAAVAAMRKHGFDELARLLAEALRPFDTYVEPVVPTTWSTVVKAYDPNRVLESISRRISNLPNYGVGKRTSAI